MNESTLTGETFPVEKAAACLEASLPISKKYNCLWQGSNVVSGTATAITVVTGRNTIFGQMAHSLVGTNETAYEKGIRHFGYFLLRATLVLSLIILFSNLYFGKPILETILFSLALAVGMAPELLPAIMTFSMAASTRQMLKKKVIVKKLSSIFNFGQVNILCTDKTGTITEGVIRIRDIVDITGHSNEQLRLYSWLNASFQKGFRNPIDEAIMSMKIRNPGYEKINEIPYDFIRKRLSVAVKKDDHAIFITKGAFKNVLETCTFLATQKGDPEELTAARKQALYDQFIRYSHEGCRVLGLSYKPLTGTRMQRDDEAQMIFLGFILLEDPLKESAIASFRQLKEMNIKVKIITGDNQYVAGQVATQLGIKDAVILTGDDIDKMSPEALMVKVQQTHIFAETEPHQKELIIKALQKSHDIVAYIGDGINDAAAINAADIGISTSNAADIAKEAADFVLMEKDLGVLADGVYEGRRSFLNSMKYIFISTGATFGNMFSIAGASLYLPVLPMLPKQILLTNLLTDLPFISVSNDNVEDDETRTPEKWDIRLIRRFMLVFGLHSSCFDFLTFYLLYFHYRLSTAAFQTGWFLESTISELLIVFVVRSQRPIMKSHPGRLLMMASLFTTFIAVLLPYSPLAARMGFVALSIHQIALILLILITFVISADVLKLIFFKYQRKANYVP